MSEHSIQIDINESGTLDVSDRKRHTKHKDFIRWGTRTGTLVVDFTQCGNGQSPLDTNEVVVRGPGWGRYYPISKFAAVGTYDYMASVTDPNGATISEDPQVIVDSTLSKKGTLVLLASAVGIAVFAFFKLLPNRKT